MTLLLGPLLRYTDETRATVWVETCTPGEVSVRTSRGSWSARTFTAHGHHFALVDATDLEPGSAEEYTVAVDGKQVWPEENSPMPPSRLRTLDLARPLRIAFGSCRTSVPHDAEGNRKHGVDAMRAYARRFLLLEAEGDTDQSRWPDLVMFLGDQVYADETSNEMRDFIDARRGLDDGPGEELADFQEYAHLYELAWSDPVNRWFLSTAPSMMIFDDHDVRDDWNTSFAWRQQMQEVPWWHERIVGALGSYWIYQHLGNLSPDERAEDDLWQQIHQVGPGTDVGGLIDALAARVDSHPDAYRWSYSRDLGRTRVVMVDSRAARLLNSERREMLDDAEFDWLDEQMAGGFDHLLIGSSLPYLMPLGLHHLEAWNESVTSGAWGDGLATRFGEWVRQTADLEHWPAFQDSFQRVADASLEVLSGKRGESPATVTFLSGDVHHSYLAEAEVEGPGRLLQAVCSPIRNPLPRAVRFGTAALSYGLAWPMGRLAAMSARVPAPPFRWRNLEGPWFDNNLATMDLDGRSMRITWEAGHVADGKHDEPTVRTVRTVDVC